MTLPHLRRLLPSLARHRRALLLGLLALFATTALSVASPWVLRLAIDELTAGLTRQRLWLYAGALLGLVGVEGFFRYQMRMVLIGLSREMEYDLRNEVFRHLTLLAPRYYQQNRIGEVMSRATNDMSAVRMVLGPGIMYTASTVATFAGAVSLMLAISPSLTLLALVPLLLVSWLVRHYGRQCWELDALSPVVLRERVDAAIRSEIHHATWNRYVEAEQLERESIESTVRTWRGISMPASE